MSMHANRIVAVVKVNGRILRESGDTITLPFGSEYALLIKNLDSVRAQVKVTVDGTNATEGGNLVIEPNSSVELERFIRDGNLHSGNRFRFIERTEAIEDHRGIGADDGLIRVEAWREAVRYVSPPIITYYPTYYPDYNYPWEWPYRRPRPHWRGGLVGALSNQQINATSFMRSAGTTTNLGNVSETSCNTQTSGAQQPGVDSVAMNMVQADAGITVPGSISSQQFHSVAGFELEPTSTVIVLRLRGKVAGAPVAQPVTVAARPICQSCGKHGRPNDKFCSACATSLVLV